MWAPMCTISLLWSIGTDLTRCDFDLGSEQAWRNERLALSDMAVVLVQSQSGYSTGLGPVEAHGGTSFRAISKFVRPDGDNMLTPPPTCVDGGEMKEAVVFQRRDGSTRLLQCGLAKTRSRSPLKERRRSGAVDGHRSFLRAVSAKCFVSARYIRHLLMQLVQSTFRQ